MQGHRVPSAAHGLPLCISQQALSFPGNTPFLRKVGSIGERSWQETASLIQGPPRRDSDKIEEKKEKAWLTPGICVHGLELLSPGQWPLATGANQPLRGGEAELRYTVNASHTLNIEGSGQNKKCELSY